MIMLTRLRDVDTIESDVTLTEQGWEEIICHAREVRIVHILSRGLKQFNPNVQFDIEIKVVSLSAGIKNSRSF